MRIRHLVYISALSAALLATVLPAEEPKAVTPEANKVERLIAQLASPTFAAREEASGRLDTLGAGALEGLRSAARHPDAEVRRRAEDLIQRIERRIETEKLLTPKRFHLVYRDRPLTEAVEDFTRKTGGFILLEGDLKKLAARKITLDTGEVPFWEALSLFCEAAGLVERRSDLVVSADDRVLSTLAQKGRTRVIDLRALEPVRRDDYVVLLEGKAPKLPTFHYGAMRLRALPASTSLPGVSSSPGHVVIPLEVVPEPGIEWKRVLGLQIDRALNDQGRPLTVSPTYVGHGSDEPTATEEIILISDGEGTLPMAVPRIFPVRVRLAEEPSVQIKELQATLTAWVQTPPEAMFTVDKVMDAAGQTFRAKDGTTLQVLAASRSGGQINLRVAVSTEPQDLGGRAMAGRVVRVVNRRMRTWPAQLPTEGGKPVLSLFDAQGKAIELMTCALDIATAGGRTTKEFQMTFRGQEEPARLVFTGRRIATVEVPFVLKDIPLK